jgi:hypothetical protein
MRISSGIAADANVTDRITRDVGWVADRWLREIRAGRAFTRGSGAGPSVGNLSECQLFNPVGSLITIIVFRIVCAGDVTGQIRLRTFNTALATLVGTGFNLLAVGAAATGEYRTATPAVEDGTTVWDHRSLASTPTLIADAWAWELGAGEGILTQQATVNQILFTAYYWIEL